MLHVSLWVHVCVCVSVSPCTRVCVCVWRIFCSCSQSFHIPALRYGFSAIVSGCRLGCSVVGFECLRLITS